MLVIMKKPGSFPTTKAVERRDIGATSSSTTSDMRNVFRISRSPLKLTPYRRVFGSDWGKHVLFMLLSRLFDHIDRTLLTMKPA